MPSYIDLTSTRSTVPDMTAVLAAIKTATGDATAVLLPTSPQLWRGKKATAWTVGQTTSAQSIIDTTPAVTPQQGFAATSRQKDILAMVALVVRAKGLVAWNAMTLQQKKDATFAEADVWATLRDFAETNL